MKEVQKCKEIGLRDILQAGKRGDLSSFIQHNSTQR